MKPFAIGFDTALFRFYLMMLVIVIAGFTGQWWLSILALPIFLSTILGIRFKGKKNSSQAKVHNLVNNEIREERKVS